jgi:hypothetical protein
VIFKAAVFEVSPSQIARINAKKKFCANDVIPATKSTAASPRTIISFSSWTKID